MEGRDQSSNPKCCQWPGCMTPKRAKVCKRKTTHFKSCNNARHSCCSIAMPAPAPQPSQTKAREAGMMGGGGHPGKRRRRHAGRTAVQPRAAAGGPPGHTPPPEPAADTAPAADGTTSPAHRHTSIHLYTYFFWLEFLLHSHLCLACTAMFPDRYCLNAGQNMVATNTVL